jgi:SAM-dependent methyltransferase
MNNRGEMSKHLQLGDILAQRLALMMKDNSHILDIGGGDGRHSMFFAEKGHKVTFNDLHPPAYEHKNIDIIVCNFMTAWIPEVDVVWISHVLEHQLDVNHFLEKAVGTVREGGLIAICVPPAKHQVVSGHVTIWNAGLVLYNLVLAGLDCSKAMILQHGYNISVIVRKKTIKLPELNFDFGDLTNLRAFFPWELEWSGDSFNGNIAELNWGL